MIKKYTACAIMAFTTMSTFALSPEHYAENSKLASGKWARVRVDETGMQLITKQQLQNLGFSDINKVRVYGYGAREIKLELNDQQVDDLPEIPSIATAKGIVFFGVDNITWAPKDNILNDATIYTHTINPYSQESYYFITESNEPSIEMAQAAQMSSSQEPANSFTARLLHESNIAFAANTGRVMFGEDFRAQTNQNFPFTLTDATGNNTKLHVVFASKLTSSGTSKGALAISANGESLGNAISIATTNSDDIIMTLSEGTYQLPNITEKCNISLRFSSGTTAVNLARLDYIQIEYDRALKLNGGELYFYDKANTGKTYNISGCSDKTQVWDVTNPAQPLKITATLSGSNLTFSAPSAKYHEYVVFNPEQISRAITPAGSIANQNLHALEIPDMLIITPSAWKSEAQRLADFRTQNDGMVVHVLTPDVIYNEFSSGAADVSAFRKIMKMWHDRGVKSERQLKYCILMSRATYDNWGVTEEVKKAGYPRLPIWQDDQGKYKTFSYSTDDILAMLDDTKGDFKPENDLMTIGIARMPVKSITEAQNAVDKIIKYETEPQYGSWRNSILFLAEDKDGGKHLTASESEYKIMNKTEVGKSYLYKRIYLDAYERQSTASGFQFPTAKADFVQALNDGVMLFNYVGHASTTSMVKSKLWTWEDMNSMTNRKLPLMFSATCELTRIDDDDVSGGEVMWLSPNSGFIGMFTTSRSVFMSQNEILGNYVAETFMQRANDGKGLRIGDWYRLSKNKYMGDTNKLRYLLVGDPALRIVMPQYKVVIDSIADACLETETPTIGAKAKVKATGHIEDQDGNMIPDYNGYIELNLYDAETVIETHGYGDTSSDKPRFYNDRINKLFRSIEYVKDGQWSSTLIIPPIIDNNNSPALLNAYAYSDNGIEAHGYTENFFVYGEYDDSDEPIDDKQPEITTLYLNSEQFADGDVVNSSPTLFASVSDDSGINIYGGTIGQELSIKVDDQIYNNVKDYYTPHIGDPCAGNIQFPLQNIEPGEHTLTLTIWDLSNNMTEKSITFKVAVGRAPTIYDIHTDVNPAKTSVHFILTHDRPAEPLNYIVDVFDLGGKKVWSGNSSTDGDFNSSLSMNWDLCDRTGARVPRGIYLYRATVTAQDGTSATKTKKLAVTAQ